MTKLEDIVLSKRKKAQMNSDQVNFVGYIKFFYKGKN